jgi:PERQ amino acid-rich with GYF domain-containing protein
MRNKQQTLASANRPPPSLLSPTLPSASPPASGASSYSSLLTPAPHAPPERQGSDNPFLYTREELLQVWKDGGGRGGLGLEVELWEGVVREVGGEPIGLKEMSEGEKKVCSVPIFARHASQYYLYAFLLCNATNMRV